MGNIIHVKGDVTAPKRIDEDEVVVIPHVCNNRGGWGWGAGVVLEISKKWKEPEQMYRDLMIGYSSETRREVMSMGQAQLVHVEPNTYIINMICQDGYKSKDNPIPLKYAALIKCMQVVESYKESLRKPHCLHWG